MGNAGGCRQKLRIRRGHGCRQNTGKHNTCNDCRKAAMLAQQVGNAYDNRFGCTALQKGNRANLCHRIPDDTNQNGNTHRNDNPDNRNSSG